MEGCREGMGVGDRGEGRRVVGDRVGGRLAGSGDVVPAVVYGCEGVGAEEGGDRWVCMLEVDTGWWEVDY